MLVALRNKERVIKALVERSDVDGVVTEADKKDRSIIQLKSGAELDVDLTLQEVWVGLFESTVTEAVIDSLIDVAKKQFADLDEQRREMRKKLLGIVAGA